MSVIDKVIAAVTPPETDKQRADARDKARSAAVSCRWLTLVLEHHQQIEACFAAIKQGRNAATRRQEQQRLALLLNGHSLAEEVVLYPALALHDEKGHATMAYTEQSAVKVQMAALDDLDPMSQDYDDKLEHIRGAIAHHVYEEEGTWYPELVEKTGSGDKLSMKYEEEFQRYMGQGATPSAMSGQPPGMQRQSFERVGGA